MTNPHHRRARIAACTALALAAGAALAAPATAAPVTAAPVTGGPHTATAPAAPEHVDLPGPLLLPGARRAAAAAAPAPEPRFDADGDRIPDMLYRALNRSYYVNPGGASDHWKYQVGRTSRYFEYKDVIPVGAVDGGPNTDLLTLTAEGELALQASQGRGGAANQTWSGRGWGVYNKLFAPGDLTRDGHVDLLARTPAGDLYLYPSTGDMYRPFGGRVKVGAGWQAYDQLVGTNDINRDGIADLVARTFAGRLYAYLGTGKKSAPLKPRKLLGAGWNAYNQVVGLDDIDGDGNGDLLGRTTAGRTYVYLGNGAGAFKPRHASQTGWNVAASFANQGGNPDFGRNDLLGRDAAGTLWWYYSKNDGTLGARQRTSKVGGWKNATLYWTSAFSNYDGASLLEVYAGHLYIDGDHKSAGWGVYNTLLGPGDLSNDGTTDLLARDRSGVLYLYQGNGVGGVTVRHRVGAGWGQYDKLIGAGDLTGDGRADLVARTRGGGLYLYRGTGAPKAPFASRVRIGTNFDIYKNLVVAGDLTGDGRSDLLGTDSKGRLWRYDSLPNAKLTARTRIGTGYQIYPDIY